jgi:RNA polymerase sigma-70 factor (ECF subfamily)
MESMKGSTDITKRFEDLYTQYRQRFVVIARRYVRNSMVAEDIVAESFVSFYNKYAKLPNDTNIPSYILTIVKNNCLNYLHAQQLHLRIDQQAASDQARMVNANIRSLQSCNPENLFANEIHSIVAEAMRKMPDLTRIVFIKSREEGKTYEMIAQECGVSVRRVTSEIQKALAMLRNALKDYMPAWLLALYLNNLM